MSIKYQNLFMGLLPSLFSYVLDDMMHQVKVGCILRMAVAITIGNTFIALTVYHGY